MGRYVTVSAKVRRELLKRARRPSILEERLREGEAPWQRSTSTRSLGLPGRIGMQNDGAQVPLRCVSSMVRALKEARLAPQGPEDSTAHCLRGDKRHLEGGALTRRAKPVRPLP